MNTTINKLVAEFDCDAIKNDYVIAEIRIQTQEKEDFRQKLFYLLRDYEGTPAIVSSCSTKEGGQLVHYILVMEPGFDKVGMRRHVSGKINGRGSVSVSDVTALVLDRFPHIAASLFLNAVAVYHGANPLTGRFLMKSGCKKSAVICVEISVTDKLAVCTDVVTLRKYFSLDEKDQKKTAMLSRYAMTSNADGITVATLSDRDSDAYVEKGFYARKSEVPFFALEPGKFERSKAGLLARTLADVKEQFGEYVSLHFLMVPFETDERVALWEKNDEAERAAIMEKINAKGITVVNRLETDEEMAGFFAKKLRAIGVRDVRIAPAEEGISRERYNIVLLEHDKDWYKGRRISDPYFFDNQEVAAVTHITRETGRDVFLNPNASEKDIRTVSFVVFKELIIKQDIQSGRVSLMDCRKFDLRSNLTVAMMQKREDVYYTYAMTLNPDGELCFESPAPEKLHGLLIKNPDNGDIIVQYEDDIVNIHTTELHPLPDLEKCMRTLVKGQPLCGYDERHTGTWWREYLCTLVGKGEKITNKARLKLFEDKVGCDENEYTLEEIKESGKKIDENRNRPADEDGKQKKRRGSIYQDIIGKINDGWFRETGELFMLSKNETIRDALWPGLLKMNSCATEKGTLYWIGPKTIDSSNKLSKGSPIREVKVLEGRDFFADVLAPMFAVEFVRWGQWTVLPFPVKYLRECIKMREFWH